MALLRLSLVAMDGGNLDLALRLTKHAGATDLEIAEALGVDLPAAHRLLGKAHDGNS